VEKLCTALWRAADADPQGLATWMRGELLPQLSVASDVRGATVHVESVDPAHTAFRHGTVADGRLLTGLVSVWLDSYQDAPELAALLEQAPVALSASYLVCESVPQAYGDVMTWPEGEPSPGLSIVTLLDKPEGTDEKVFYHYWHELHRVTTAECHPFASYVRNEVARPLTDGAPRWRGIVTESSPDVQDFLDPHRFYVSGGDRDQLKANQRRVVEETSVFIDFATIQVAPMTEIVVRRLAATSP
jgi:hypothetical protein